MTSVKDINKLREFESSFWEDKNIEYANKIYLEIFDNKLFTQSPIGTLYRHSSLQNTYFK